MPSSKDLIKALMKLKNAKRAKSTMHFVGIKPGLYGENDKLLGICMPDIRKTIKEYLALPLTEIYVAIVSEYHEIRMAAVLILLHHYKKSGTDKEEKRIFDFYIEHVNKNNINNWDFVDMTAPNLTGPFLFKKSDKGMSVLVRFAKSSNLWLRRVAVISTFYHIRQESFDITLSLAQQLLNDEHHLIHKAVGWMLREIGKRDEIVLTGFLDNHCEEMPRIMLSYSIEKFKENKRKHYMGFHKACLVSCGQVARFIEELVLVVYEQILFQVHGFVSYSFYGEEGCDKVSASSLNFYSTHLYAPQMGCVLETCIEEISISKVTGKEHVKLVGHNDNAGQSPTSFLDPQSSDEKGKSQLEESRSFEYTNEDEEKNEKCVEKKKNKNSGGDTDGVTIKNSEDDAHHGQDFSVVLIDSVVDVFNEDLRYTDSMEDVTKAIDRIWETIYASIAEHQNNTIISNAMEGGTKEIRRGWKVIHLFISSTFADFYAEREIIVKKVMPELQEFCEQYKIQLLECDLRWGVPKNTASDETISICLDELSRCITETDGQPFFLNMLGDRYGWIPTKDYISENTREKFEWIYPSSITHMEIVHAALRTKSCNAMFTVRKEESLNGIPEKFNSSFIDSSLFSKQNLKRLKNELGTIFPEQMFEYKSMVSGVDDSTGMEKVTFGDLDEFAALVIKFFKTRIEEYAMKNLTDTDALSELSEYDKMACIQETFIQKRGQFLIGREGELRTMMNFIQNTDQTEDEERKLNEVERILFVIAEPGTGKSSLVANYVMKLKENNVPCLYNFSSSAPGSTDTLIVLQRFCEELARRLNEDLPDAKTLSDYESLSKYFEEQLKHISEKYPGFTIVLDAINQFSDVWGLSCDWLPVPSSEVNVRYVISCTPEYGEGYTKSIEKFEVISDKINLSGFDINCRMELVTRLFQTFNKRLDDEQLNLLVSLDASSSPLWLALACEELRVFGVFEQVTEHIKKLPDTITDLLGLIFERLIREDETGKVRETLCYLNCAKTGLTESELRRLLSSDTIEKGENSLPMMVWATIRRKIKAYLLNTGFGQEEQMYTFVHASMYQTVSNLLLSDNQEFCNYNSKLATEFLKYGRDELRTTNAISKHLVNARCVQELIKFFRQDKRSIRMSEAYKGMTLSKFRCMQQGGSQSSPVFMCTMCDMKKIFQSPMRTKDLCVICGRWVPNKTENTKAKLCRRHEPFIPTTTAKCYFCKKVLFMNQKQIYVNLHLCVMCVMVKRCVAIDG